MKDKIELTREEATTILRQISRFEGWTWGVKDSDKAEMKEALFTVTEMLAEKLK